MLEESISSFGFNNPILISKDNRIIAGHARVMVVQRNDMDEVPAIVLPLDGTKAGAYLILDNKLCDMSRTIEIDPIYVDVIVNRYIEFMKTIMI